MTTNPDVLTLAVAAAESVSRHVSYLGWVKSMDVGWSYFPPDRALPYSIEPGFFADVVPVLGGMPVVRPAVPA